MKLHSAWIIELSELEAIFRKKDVSAFKAFITARTDAIRKPYGRVIEELPRTNVFGASTNEDGFLNDPTGNRRFWVVKVHQPIDIAQLAQEKDRIWAAAVALYKAHEQWYPTQLEAIAAEAIAQDYQQADPWLEVIHEFVRDRETVLTSAVLATALQVEVGRQSKADEMRVASCLRELGFQATRKTIKGRRTRVWVKSPDNLANLGQPQSPRLSNAEKPIPQQVNQDWDNRDNRNPLNQPASNSTSISAFHSAIPPPEPIDLIEKVVPVVQVGQSNERKAFSSGQPANLRSSRLANSDFNPTEPAALQVGDRVAVWAYNRWQPATLIAVPNYQAHPSQWRNAWKARLDTGQEIYVWDVQHICLLSPKRVAES